VDVRSNTVSKQDLTQARWRKSSRSNGEQACVELAVLTEITAVRDSKNPLGGALQLAPAAWVAFRFAVKRDGFDAL
jgi:hypothetical protein